MRPGGYLRHTSRPTQGPGFFRMNGDRVSNGQSSYETKMAMFWAALAAQCAGEPSVTGSRIVEALVRTNAVGKLCQHLQVDPQGVIDAVEDPQVLSFAECERRVRADLARKDLEFGSKEHQTSVQRRPLEPAVKGVFDAMLERHGNIGASPLELLLDLICATPTIADQLAPLGLTAESISAVLDDADRSF